MLLDRFLTDYSFREIHAIEIEASPGHVLNVLKLLNPDDVPLVGFMMALRSVPAFLVERKIYRSNGKQEPLVYQIVGNGFLILGEDPEKEIVLGTIGQFWKPVGNLCTEIRTPEEFLKFQAEGWAKAVWNFHTETNGQKTSLVTETRILPLGAEALRSFGRYWLFIRGGSGLIRRVILRAVKRKAESPQA